MKKISPLEFRTLYSDALVSFSRGNVTHARDMIQQVLSVNPDNLQSIYLSGLIDLRLGSYASAEESLRKVVTQVPGEVSPTRVLAALYLRTGRATQAVETLEGALRRAPDNPVLLRSTGEAQLAAGNAAKAAKYYERANALDKGNMASEVRLAQVKYAAGDTGAGIQGTRIAVQHRPVAISGGPRADHRVSAPRGIHQGPCSGRRTGKKATEQPAHLQYQGRYLRGHARQQKRAGEFRKGVGSATWVFRRSAQPRIARRSGTEGRRRAQALRGHARQGPEERAAAAGTSRTACLVRATVRTKSRRRSIAQSLRCRSRPGRGWR